MGLIKAITTAVGGVLADQWLDFFSCDAIPPEVLVIRGQKYTGGRGSNNKGNDNIISNGSGIIIADGQCMIIVDQGKVAEICAEPGQYTYDASTEASLFFGSLGENIVNSFKNIGARFSFGGSPGKDQRVYYINTKEILGNKYGTQNPVPFRVVDTNIGLDVDIAIRCNGEYSYKITDPVLFYANVTGNVTNDYTRDQIDSQLKAELLTALQPAFAKISAMGVRYSALPEHTLELSQALNDILSKKWKELRGIEIASFAVNSATASKEDEDMIKELQKTAVLRNPNMAAAAITSAQADAMRAAASNENGAMMGFMGLGFAQQAGGVNAQSLYGMGQQGQPQASGAPAAPAPGSAPGGGFAGVVMGNPESMGGVVTTWQCTACGHAGNDGKFCEECGVQMPPSQSPIWSCTQCGHAGNDGKFCTNCGKPRV
jgi:membrane protease subunit (stomatin/prohibitin family)